MNDIDTLFNLISKSNLTLIGYTHRDERLKNDFISHLNPIFIDKVDNSSIQSYIRDSKISTIFNEFIDSKSIVFNLNDSFIPNIGGINFIREIAENLRKIAKLGYNPIMTSLLHQTISSNQSIYNFKGGSVTLYVSELVIKFENGNINVIKNRNGDSFSIPYSKLEKLLYI